LAYSGGFKYTATLPIDLGLRAGAKLREATQAFVDAVKRLQGFWEVRHMHTPPKKTHTHIVVMARFSAQRFSHSATICTPSTKPPTILISA
jgi:hypothetical protein